MLIVLCRTVLIYFFLIALLRYTGKRQIGQLQPSELVVTLMLSELAVSPISDESRPLLFALLPIVLLSSLEVLIAHGVTKSRRMKKAFDGSPSFLIYKGELSQRELARQRLSLDEFLSQLRLCGYPDISEIAYAVMEQNGQISVIPHAGARPVQCGDLRIPADESGMQHPLIIDGEISRYNLALLQKSEAWLHSRLAAAGISAAQTFFFSCDDAGKEILIPREEKK